MTVADQGCSRCAETDRAAAPDRRGPAAPFLRPAAAPGPPPTPAEVGRLCAALRDREIRSHFQPIVELESRSVVGHEALARLANGPLGNADDLFRVARASGHLQALDWECSRAALSAADRLLRPDDVLFLNAEPSTFGQRAPAGVVELFVRQAERRRVVVEISERSVLVNPARLLAGIDTIRGLGVQIALDDVGVSADSLALMPFVDPDVIKLDMSLVHGTTSLEVARLLRAVHAQVERTGAVVLAEGIETEAQLTFAREIGATFGQGWLFGRPTAQPEADPGRQAATALSPIAPAPEAETPFAAVPSGLRPSIGSPTLLRSVSDDLADMAPHLPSAPMVLVSAPDRFSLDARTSGRLRALAEACTFVGLCAADTDTDPDAVDLPGVRTATRPRGAPAGDEWAVVVLSSHFSGALLARRLDEPPSGPDGAARYEYVISHDRTTVVRAGAAILRTIGEA